jgi:hypothetical protein
MTRHKKIRNGVYKICGIVIILSIACIALLNFPPIEKLNGVKDFRLWTFVFEALALFAFGTSWLVKGEMILKDPLPMKILTTALLP